MNNFSIPSNPSTNIELHTGHNSRFNPELIYNVLAKTPNGDLVEGFLTEGQSITIMPAEYHNGMTDVFFILEGEVVMRAKGQSKLLGPQSLLCSDSLHNKATLTARSSVRYIHFLAPPWLLKNDNEGTKIEMDEGSFEFVFSRGSVELTLGTLKSGETLYAVPEDEGSIEVYYVISGLLTLDQDKPVLLKPNDYFVARDLSDTLSSFANTDVCYLYFSNLAKKGDIEAFHNDIIKLAEDVEQKDGYTAEHCTRLQTLSKRTGKLLGLSTERMFRLNYGARLHDLGKVKVPLSILRKPGKLNAEEWKIIKKHPSYGREILDESNLTDVGVIVEQHHERLDGSGYPYGLKGNEILIESYIVAVADTYDAMTTDRPYRKALTKEFTFEEISSLADKHYPKEVVDAFIEANEDD